MSVEDKFSIDKTSVIPIYYQLAKLLEGQIRRGELKPGEALPSEPELSERFSISRMTVRKAIAELVAQGMVYATQGKGTFVSKPKLDNVLFELDSYNWQLNQRGLNWKTNLLEVRIVRANDELKRKFQVTDDHIPFLFFRTVLLVEDEPLVYEKKYTLYTKSSPILETEIKDPSLPGLITAHGGEPMAAKKILQVSLATEEEGEVLEIPPKAPVFLLEQTIYNGERQPMGWSKSVYRGDRYQLTAFDGWYEESEE